jgi:hypothetical protein
MLKSVQKRLLSVSEEVERILFIPGGNFSVGLYGMGSKINVIDAIQVTLEADGCQGATIIRIRGYDETFPLIRTMAAKLSKSKRSARNQKDVLQILTEYKQQVILLIDSIDAEPMRCYQKFFVTAAAQPHVSLCASIDHPKIGLLWSPAQLRCFNWYWIEASTYQPYKREIAGLLGTWENLIEGRFESGSTKSIKVVLNSLTGNHKDIVQLIATMQLDKETAGGIRQSDLLKLSTKRMIATNLSKLKSLLQELIDHKVVVEEKEKSTGNDLYWIPLDKDGLVKLTETATG